MKQKYFLKIALVLIMTCSFSSFSQIFTEAFDNDTGFTKSETFANDGSSDYFGILDATGISNDFDGNFTNATPSGLPSFSGFSGLYLVGEDLDGELTSSTQTLTWSGISISGFSGLNISANLAASSGFDSGEGITIAVSIDGGAYTAVKSFTVASGFNQFPTDGFTTLGPAMQTINANIAGTGNTMNIRMTFTAGSGGEEFAVDDLILNGNLASSPTIGFNSTTSSETETNTTFTSANIPITVSNYDGNQIDVNVSVTGGTAEAGDYTFTSPTSLSFTADGTQNITFDVNDDADSDNETIIFTITETSSVTGLVISEATHTATITDDDIPNIVISEIVYNTPSTDDEWIELYNADASAIDITGWTIDVTSLAASYTIPTLSIPAGDYVTIAIGSNGDGIYNNENPFTPDANVLGVINNTDVKDENDTNHLGNGSSTITLKNGTTTIDIVTYDDGDVSATDGSGVSYEIIDITVDNSTTASNWQGSIFNGGSPGRVNGSTWSGATDNDWDTATNWSTGVPIATSDVLIPNGVTNFPTASSAISFNRMQIKTGASVIAQSSVTGNVTYDLGIPDTNWHLVSSPVVGETYDDDWISDNSIAISGTGNRGVSTYQNGTPDATTGPWTYMQSGGSGTFDAGVGYSNKRSTAGNYSFTGTFPTSDVSPTITQGTHQEDNLIGNPYPSYLDVNAFLTANTSNINSSYAAVYVWNGSAYTNLTTGYIHPGQAFFINSSVASGTATITEAMQSHNTGSFYRTGNTAIKLTVSNGILSKETQINYLDGKTLGLDPRFDVGMFKGIASDLSVFTQLIEGYEDIAFETQALPTIDMESMIIPVGVKAIANEEITFSVEALQLPTDMKVFLEDRLSNTFTRLDEANTEYSITLTDGLNGTGRFYIHSSRSALGLEDLALSSVSIYASNANTLRIIGLPQGNTSVNVFNIQGKQMLSTSFEANNVEEISLPKLATGIYIVDIQTATGKLSEKIILE